MLTLVKEVSDLIPNVGPLSQVLGITGELFAIIKQVEANAGDCVFLVERILRFLKDIAEQCIAAPIRAGSPNDALLKKLILRINLIKTDAEKWQTSSYWRNIWRRDAVKDAIAKHGTNLEDCFRSFNTGALLSLGAQVDSSTHPIIAPTGLADGHIFHGLVVLEAMHDRGGTRVCCLEGTRQPAIDEFFQWVESGDTLLCWFSGPAGSGKSALSQSIAERCFKDKILAASFFFLRGAGPRSSFTNFITTLAFQLMLSFPGAKAAIESALREDVKIDSQSMQDQLNKLIIRPLAALVRPHDSTPSVIIIDAMDECNDRKTIQDFIGILASACSNHQLPVRFLLTSRGEDHIRQAFLGDAAGAETTSFDLGNFNARTDINTFLKSCFATIIKLNPRLFQGLPLPWPSAADLETLEEQSSGLFIFASTLSKFVTDGTAPPNEKLQAVMNLNDGLDPLYDQVLRAVPKNDHFRAVLTTLMLVREQPSIELLADLLQLSNQKVLHALMPIQSIICIPADDKTPIQLNHTSLRDFIAEKSRSNDLFINPPMAHFTLAIECVKVLNKTPLQEAFPTDAAPEYASQNWLIHLGNSRGPSEVSLGILSILTDFCSSEVISLGINALLLSRGNCYEESRSALAGSIIYYNVCISAIHPGVILSFNRKSKGVGPLYVFWRRLTLA